ncbi:carboxymuconolactone decarboxylase family protein [Pseudohongiella nitratireducens]|mgnify:CR=1 FL=1|uniref:carboxymuconolactone decarboxylase family protein n=1 Tax=Pseudohongiella nitratireducens TaxID=1768907 RepID=UPI0030ECA328|tara:strand:- start:1341 stop:1793 length:453 start_codon:yes stop_codon:yes gene_type:complete
MQPRISSSSLYRQCPRLITHLTALGDVPEQAAISPQLLHLVRLRASQLNGCGFCQHMHADEARQDGEAQERLDVLAAWREISGFSEQERAALAWTEALTLISQKPVDEAVFQAAKAALGEAGLIELSAIIVQINSWNRIAVGFGFQPGMK